MSARLRLRALHECGPVACGFADPDFALLVSRGYARMAERITDHERTLQVFRLTHAGREKAKELFG